MRESTSKTLNTVIYCGIIAQAKTTNACVKKPVENKPWSRKPHIADIESNKNVGMTVLEYKSHKWGYKQRPLPAKQQPTSL